MPQAHPLQQQFDQINLSDYVQVQYLPELSHQTLQQAIKTDWLEQMLQKQKEGRANLDRRGEAAFLIGRFSFVVAIVLARCQIQTGLVPYLVSDQLAVLAEHDRIAIQLSNNKAIEWQDQDGVRSMLVAFFQPMVAQLAQRAKLAPAKQWCLISDSFAMTWQFVGEPLGQAPQARSAIIQLLNGAKSPLKNRRTRFEEYKLFTNDDDQIPAVHKFIRLRAGCCRKFSDDGQYCNTCVYVPEQERKQLITKLLWESHLGASSVNEKVNRN